MREIWKDLEFSGVGSWCFLSTTHCLLFNFYQSFSLCFIIDSLLSIVCLKGLLCGAFSCTIKGLLKKNRHTSTDRVWIGPWNNIQICQIWQKSYFLELIMISDFGLGQSHYLVSCYIKWLTTLLVDISVLQDVLFMLTQSRELLTFWDLFCFLLALGFSSLEISNMFAVVVGEEISRKNACFINMTKVKIKARLMVFFVLGEEVELVANRTQHMIFSRQKHLFLKDWINQIILENTGNWGVIITHFSPLTKKYHCKPYLIKL